jgi:WXG100 family type VII secretion target
MTSGTLFARIAQMREAANSLRYSAIRIHDSMDAVENEVKTLGADRYQSVAAEEFRREYNRLMPELKQAYDDLMRFHDKLNRAADDIEIAARPTN